MLSRSARLRPLHSAAKSGNHIKQSLAFWTPWSRARGSHIRKSLRSAVFLLARLAVSVSVGPHAPMQAPTTGIFGSDSLLTEIGVLGTHPDGKHACRRATLELSGQAPWEFDWPPSGRVPTPLNTSKMMVLGYLVL